MRLHLPVRRTAALARRFYYEGAPKGETIELPYRAG